MKLKLKSIKNSKIFLFYFIFLVLCILYIKIILIKQLKVFLHNVHKQGMKDFFVLKQILNFEVRNQNSDLHFRVIRLNHTIPYVQLILLFYFYFVLLMNYLLSEHFIKKKNYLDCPFSIFHFL